MLEGCLWSAQQEVCQSVVAHRYTAVQAGHGVGKSYLAGSLTAWWLLNHPVGHTRVVTTAPTAAQVEHVIWLEIKRVHAKLAQARDPLTGNHVDLRDGSYITAGNQPGWKTRGGQLTIAIGRKPADHDDNGFQGFHDDYLLVIVDEACGVPKNLFDGVDSVATGADNRIVAFGNPTDRGSHFFKVCKNMADWHTIRIDLLKSPNMNEAACEEFPELRAILREAGIRPSTEVVPAYVAKSISSAAFVVEKARMWGTKSSLWQSKIRGEFPDDDHEGVIPLAWVEAAQRRWIEWDEGIPVMRDGRATGQWKVPPRAPVPGIPIISCDVSGGGEDATAIGYRVGNVYIDYKKFQGEDNTTRIFKRLLVAQGPDTLAMPYLEYIVDATGEGKGVYDRLVEHFHDLNLPIAPHANAFISAAGAPKNTDDGLFGFRNKRAWAWWNLRMLLTPHQRGGSRIMLPPDDNDELLADLTTPRYKIAETGMPPKITVESKDDIRERLGRSTDLGDACVMAFTVSARPRPEPQDDRSFLWGGKEYQTPHNHPDELVRRESWKDDDNDSDWAGQDTSFGDSEGF